MGVSVTLYSQRQCENVSSLFRINVVAQAYGGGDVIEYEVDDELDGDGGGSSKGKNSNYECSVTAECYVGLGQVHSGSVSCKGTVCKQGYQWVECNGKRTKCGTMWDQ
jgi:hypothetical protein